MVARVVVACLGVLFATQSCTAVLGMERATLDESVAAGGSGATGVGGSFQTFRSPCSETPSSECTTCLSQTCGSVYTSCVSDYDCRLGLDEYARCLGDRCNKTVEECASQTLSRTLTDCLSNCESQCVGTTLALPCVLYCGCTTTLCDNAEYQQAHPGDPIPLGPDCMTRCEAAEASDPGLAACRRDHCEWGKGALNHCEHATGLNPVCEKRPAPKGPSICLGKKEKGWPCDEAGECCDGVCSSGACN